jgi:hypothetical protein
VLTWNQPEPGSKLPAVVKVPCISDSRCKGAGRQWTNPGDLLDPHAQITRSMPVPDTFLGLFNPLSEDFEMLEQPGDQGSEIPGSELSSSARGTRSRTNLMPRGTTNPNSDSNPRI